MADELHNIERDVLKRGTAKWRKDVQAVKEAVYLLYTPFIGTELTDAQVSLIVYRLLQLLDSLEVDPEMDEIVLRGILKAHQIGLRIAARGSEHDVDLLDIQVSEESKRAIIGMAARAQDAVTRSKVALTDPTSVNTLESVIATMKPVFDSPVQVERATTWSMNHAKNSAIDKVAQQTGERTCWVPERSSCLHCAAYAGLFSGPNGFPKGLTFMDKPLKTKGFLFGPPLHPNCRCDLEIGLSEEYAAGLKREAIREVLKGTSIDSVSDAAKVRAAKRLLEQNPDVPGTVEKYAKDAVKRGTFVPPKKRQKKTNG